jgi:hypothetical protein
MTPTRESVLAAAMTLPESERLEIAVELLGCLPPEIIGLSLDDPDLHAKLEARSRDRDGSVTWEELQAELGREP